MPVIFHQDAETAHNEAIFRFSLAFFAFAAIFLFWPFFDANAAGPIEISSGAKQTLAEAVNNIVLDLGGSSGPFITLFRGFCFLSGIALVLTGIVGLSKRDTPPMGAIVAIGIGVLVLGVIPMLEMFMGTIFEEGVPAVISGADESKKKDITFATESFIRFSIFMVQIVGFCAVYRGLKTLADISLTHQRQPQQARAAWIYLFAGVMCVNIVGTIKMIALTAAGAGTNEVLDLYNQLFGKIGGILKK